MKRKKLPTDILIYALELVFWGTCAAHIYRTLAFRPVAGWTLDHSNLLFWGIWAVCMALGFFLTPRRSRGWLTALATVATPMSIYFILTYFELYRVLIVPILAVTLAVLAGFLVLVVVVNVRSCPRGRLRLLLAATAHRARMILCTGLSALYLAFILSLFLGSPLMSPAEPATDPRVSRQRIADNLDTVLLLEPDTWATLTPGQRLDVLQTVANIEATYLGLPHELNVQVANLQGELLGQYNDLDHTISLNPDHLTSGTPYELVKTIAHEAYHAYQRRLVDLYSGTDGDLQSLLVFDRVTEYQANFAHYIDGKDDPEGYSAQAVEQDSNRYGYDALDDYFGAIADYYEP